MRSELPPAPRQLRLFLTPEHPCSYLPDRKARTLFIDPSASKDAALSGSLTEQGFRRSGGQIYRPQCDACHCCIPARLPVNAFEPRRSQRRVWQRNIEEFQVRWQQARLTDEYFDLYARYLGERHGEGEMANPTSEDFSRFLISPWNETLFLEVRRGKELVAVAVTDHFPGGLSAVYTFFDPAIADRSPGVFAILCQIAETRRLGLPWLYLGYWVHNCRKMAYKSEYRPIQILTEGRWREFGPGARIHVPEMSE